jgi:signal transduction histidine kinase
MTSPLTPEILIPRLGETLIQRGLITPVDLQKALSYQKEKKLEGQVCLLGQALIELNLLSRPQIDNAVTEQIILLRNALENANLTLERRVAERTRQLQEALQRLSELSQMKANFVANVSHELRTPLTHMIGYLELLDANSLGPMNQEQENAVKVSLRAAGRLSSLIDNLILFSLAARGELTLQLAPVNLKKVADAVIKMAWKSSVDRNVRLKFVGKSEIPYVQADEEKISWVILQLVDNAIKFTPSGGDVILSIQPETAMLIGVSVTDTGIGIPADRLGEVFEVFHQLDSSSTRHYSGTGLGLALVHQIITAHGSVIEVESEEGKGTRFHFPLLITDIGS